MKTGKKYLSILIMIGVSVPMLLALFLYHPIGPDNPFLFPVAVFTGIVGFFLAGSGK